MDPVNVRNLEQILEEDSRRPNPRVLTSLFFGIAVTAVVVASVMMAKRSGPPAESNVDPLAELVQDAKNRPQSPEQLRGSEVSFSEILSDSEQPTTALAAVKDDRGRLRESDAPEQSQPEPWLYGEPPPPEDRLPVVPLPAGTLLHSTPVTNKPKDALVELAAKSAAKSESEELAPMGSDTGYQIQVASFKKQSDADEFVEELRRRGHTAFRIAAQVPGRGLWHRVRIGPFKTRYKALIYKQKFEKTERMSPFLIDPDKQKRAEEIRQARLAARIKKYGQP